MSYADQLEELRAALTEAGERRRTARAAAEKPWTAGQVVGADLAAYHHDVTYRVREADPEEARLRTLSLLRRIEDEGLTLVPIDPKLPAAGLRIFDPKPAQELDAATAAVLRARSAVTAFERDHADDLKAERDDATMGRVRDALAGNDPSALREALHA